METVSEAEKYAYDLLNDGATVGGDVLNCDTGKVVQGLGRVREVQVPNLRLIDTIGD